MANPSDYERFNAFAQAFSASHPQKDILGDYYDHPDKVVYRQATHKLPEGGRIEVNTITPETPSSFAWEAEITINDKVGKRFIHLILQRNQEVAETYGKTIIPVDTARANEILGILAELRAS